MSSWIDRAIAIRTVDADDVPTNGKFRIWKFVGATLVPDGDRLVITITGGGGGSGTPYDSDPAEVSTGEGGPGVSDSYARGDHVHAHGNRAGGTLHAVAIAAGNAGFMSGADKTKLDGIAAGATANAGTVTVVSGGALISVATGTTTPVVSVADVTGPVVLGRVTASAGAPTTVPIYGIASPTRVLGVDAAGACTADVFNALSGAGRFQGVGSTLYAGYSDTGTVVVSGYLSLTLECRAGDALFSAAAFGRCVAGGSWSIKCGLTYEKIAALNSADEECFAILFPARPAAITSATDTTVASFAAVARPGVIDRYVFCRRTSGATAATTAIWFVRFAHILEGGVAVQIGAPVVELISASDDGCSLTVESSGTVTELFLSTPDATSRTASARVLEAVS